MEIKLVLVGRVISLFLRSMVMSRHIMMSQHEKFHRSFTFAQKQKLQDGRQHHALIYLSFMTGHGWSYMSHPHSFLRNSIHFFKLTSRSAGTAVEDFCLMSYLSGTYLYEPG